VTRLFRSRLDVFLVGRRSLLRSRLRLNAARSVKTRVGVIDGRIVNDRLVHVNVGDTGAVHIHDRGVIEERATAPLAAAEPDATVTEAVIHAAVEADVFAPVSAVPSVKAAFKSPIARCPEEAGLRRRDPSAGNPEVAFITPRPIAGGPHESCTGTHRLFINR